MDKIDAYKILALDPGAGEQECNDQYGALKERIEKLLRSCENDQEEALMHRQLERLETAYASLTSGEADIASTEPATAPEEVAYASVGAAAVENSESSVPVATHTSTPEEIHQSIEEPSPQPQSPRKKSSFSFTGAKLAIWEALTPKKGDSTNESELPPPLPINTLKSDWKEKEKEGFSINLIPSEKMAAWGLPIAGLIFILASGAGIWKAATYNTGLQKEALAQLTLEISSLNDSATDTELQKIKEKVSLFSEEAEEQFASDARSALDAKISEIQKVRQEIAQAAKEEQQLQIGKLSEQLRELQRKQRWLRNTVSSTESRSRQIQAMLSREQNKEKIPYLTELNSSFDSYRRWLGRFDREHPLHSSIRDAQNNINRGQLNEADLAIARGKRSIPALEEQIELQKTSLHGQRMIKWMQAEGHEKAIEWLKRDDPEVISLGIADLKSKLSRLDRSPATEDSVVRLENLALLAGKNDPDYKRWRSKALPDIRIESAPSGAKVINIDGDDLGRTPLTLRDMDSGSHTLGVELKGYEVAILNIRAEINGKTQTIRTTLEKLVEPEQNQPYTAQLPGGIKMELPFIKKGSFRMGSPANEKGRNDNEAQRNVTVGNDFWLGKTEVTQVQWESLMDKTWRNDVHTRDGNRKLNLFGADRPIHSISWEEVVQFCKLLTEHERKAGRITENFEFRPPTEEQWEYACRAGTRTPFHFGNILTPDRANFNGLFPYNSSARTSLSNGVMAVGSFPANAFGLHDMHGNVWEWCITQNSQETKTTSGNQFSDIFSSQTRDQVVRGGSWFSTGAFCRSAIRRPYSITYKENTLGLRVSLNRIGGGNILQLLRENAIDGEK